MSTFSPGDKITPCFATRSISRIGSLLGNIVTVETENYNSPSREIGGFL